MDTKLAQTVARELVHEYLDDSWGFDWDRAKTRFGCCNYNTRTIRLSLPLTQTNSEADVLDTILHEIAHALTPGHGHDRVWSKMAISLGANGKRCSKTAKGVSYKYAGWCQKCNTLADLRHKKGRLMKAQRYLHRGCGGRLQYLANVADHDKDAIGQVVRAK